MERFEKICDTTGFALTILFGVSGAAFLLALSGYLALRIIVTLFS